MYGNEEGISLMLSNINEFFTLQTYTKPYIEAIESGNVFMEFRLDYK